MIAQGQHVSVLEYDVHIAIFYYSRIPNDQQFFLILTWFSKDHHQMIIIYHTEIEWFDLWKCTSGEIGI